MKYGIVIYPAKEVQDRVNALRKRYDSHYNLIPPHITIKEAFDLEAGIEEVVNHLTAVTQDFPPFNLRINRIKSFSPTSPVLYLGIEENPEINKLYEQVNSGALKYQALYNFIPHITIAQDLTSQEISDIYSRLSLQQFDLSFLVDRIHLCYQMDNGSWSHYQTFLLNGSY